MGVEAKLQPSDPPPALATRSAYVQLNALNTIAIPHDLKDDNAGAWAFTANVPATQPKREQRVGSNEVVYFVDGMQTFPQFRWEIEQTNGEHDFIYLLGWYLNVELLLPDVSSDDGSIQNGKSVKDLLSEAGKRKVQIRVMLDGQYHDLATNEKAADFILYGVDSGDRAPLPTNGPPRSVYDGHIKEPNPAYDEYVINHYMKYYEPRRALLNHADTAGVVDKNFPEPGSHHQKILIVKHGKQLTAFCGGLDMNSDRIQADAKGRDPQHDMHCRIRGPAALDVLKIFLDRWDDYVSRLPAGRHAYEEGPLDFLLADKGALRGKKEKEPAPCGKFSVQIARTTGPYPYKFAPAGERSIRELLKVAIPMAHRFIYIEDQYLVDMEIAGLLRDQLAQLRHVTILIPPGRFVSNPQGVYRRKLFVEEVRKGGVDKVRVFCLNKSLPTCGTYIHSKTWIFDDKFAIIGSANCDRRGMTFDSEVVAGIFDPSTDDKLSYTFAHRLRIKLWAHHLGMDNADGHAELADGVASAENWATRASMTAKQWYPIEKFLSDDARIVECDLDESIEKVHTDTAWGTEDPDGS